MRQTQSSPERKSLIYELLHLLILSSCLNEKNEKLTSSDMSVVWLESSEAAGVCGHGLTDLPGDCLIGVLGAVELLKAMGVCNIKM